MPNATWSGAGALAAAAGAARFVDSIMSLLTWVVPFVVLVGTIIFVHELGHFLAAKRAGVKVYEFAVGFGRALFQRKIGETVYSVRLVPLGGFVKMAGMDPAVDPSEAVDEDSERSFSRKSVGQRMGIIAAGPFMNFLLAIVLFTVFHAFVALPLTIGGVVPDSPAARAGLAAGDIIVSADGREMPGAPEFIAYVQSRPHTPIDLVIERDGVSRSVTVTPAPDAEGRVLIGVMLQGGKATYPLGRSLVMGIRDTGQAAVGLLAWLGRVITGKAGAAEVRDNLTGPIGIAILVGESAQRGIGHLVVLGAMINVTLGLLNLLPIPVLDGGWLLFLLLEAVRGKPLNPEHQGIAQFIGLALILLLMLFATYSDIHRLLSPGGS